MSKYPGRIVTDLAPAGYSVFFDGTGDYLTGPTNTATAFNLTGNFTIECWAYFNSVATSFAGLVSWADSSGWNGWQFLNNAGTLTFEFLTGSAGAGTTTSSAGALTTGRWFHLAAVRSGSTITLYINGVSSGTPVTYSSSQTSSSSFIKVAADRLATALTTGYISNVRVVNGTALYTAAFTPPTQPLNIPNTSLLTCNSPAIIDQSNNAFAITVNGNSAVSTFTPFTAYVPYNPALGASTPGVWTLDEALQAKGTRRWNMYDPSFNLTTLLLHGNGTNGAQNNTFLDSSSNNFTITRNGNTTQGTFSPFSQTGWSNFFNGSTDYISVADNAAFTLGSGDFTIEFWVYSTTAGTRQFFAGQMNSAGANISVSFSIEKTSGNKLLGAINSGTTQYAATSSGDIPLNAWTHIALVRDGNTLRQYINGVQDGTVSVTGVTANDSSSQLAIGRVGEFTSNYYFGYISNFRFVKGTCLYTGGTTFTPPTSPLTNITNTSLLTCQSNRFVDNSTANSGSGFTITANGTPSVQAFSPFYPTAAYTPATVGGSGYFDGTTDWLSIANNAAFDLGTGDCTVECWLYRATSGTLQGIVTAFPSGGTPINGWGLYINTSNFVYMDSWVGNVEQTFTASDNAIPVNAWTHIAYTRQSGTSRLFVDGRLCTATGPLTQAINTGGFELQIGRSNYGATNYVTGYISNLRIVKGTAVYTAAFTPATAPLSAITNTSLLLGMTNAGIVDSTAKNVLETVGNAQISTTQSKFGGSSIAFDGTGDVLVAPNSVNWDMGSGSYTIEFWLYMNTLTGNQTFIARANNGSTYATFDIGWYVSGLRLYVSNNGSSNAVSLTSSISPSATTWTHIAVTRNGSTYTIWVNGSSGGTATDSGSAVANGNKLGIGGLPDGVNSLNGYIEELRITKGIARYTAAFTPQTSQWQDE